jgi:5-methylcytosine-specific restriction endonuclease McrA
MTCHRAIAKLFKSDGKSYEVEVVSTYDDKFYTRNGVKYNYPSVIVFKHYQHLGKNKKPYATFNRRAVWNRDNKECQYCGITVTYNEMTWDHVLPKSRGGNTDWKNLVTCCKKCNTKKANKTPEEANMRLRKKPIPLYSKLSVHENIIERLRQTITIVPHESWKTWLYWDVKVKK